MLKVILVEPTYSVRRTVYKHNMSFPLLWALALGTYLKEKIKSNLDIKVLDGQLLTVDQILQKIKKIKPDFIGLCPKYTSYENSLIIARIARKLGAKVIMGGPHVSFLAKEILLNRGSQSDDYCVDACIYGDGEKAFYEYIIGKSLSSIKNLIFVKNKEIIENPKEYLNIDLLPTIDRNLIDTEKYFRLNQLHNRIFPVYSHRGCFSGSSTDNKGCIFCGGDKKLRHRQPINFWKEIDHLVKKYKAEVVFNSADGMPLNEESDWFREFCNVANFCKNKPRLILRTLPHFINSKTIKTLKKLKVTSIRMPVTHIFPGCAFGPAKISAKMNIKYLKQICHPFKLLSDADIYVDTYIKLGAFRETEEDFKSFLKLSSFLSSYKKVNVAFVRGYMPFPGTEGWQMILKKTGQKYKNKDVIDWRDVAEDWIEHFSDIETNSTILKFLRKKKKIK